MAGKENTVTWLHFWVLKDFETVALAPFTSAQIRFFTDTWYRKVAPLKGMSESSAEKRAAMLNQAIESNPRLRELAGRPLLLTLMACLHAWYSGALPEKREELYRETVDLLLDCWERAKWGTAANGAHKMEEPSLAHYLKTDRGAIRKLLDHMAFQAHADQPDLVSGLVEISNNPDVQPLRLVEYLSQRAGILAQRAEGVFTFPHRTFQEYLAACYLAETDFPEKIVELFKNDPERWREAVLLAGTRHAFSGPLGVWTLAEQLCCDACVPGAGLDCVWGAHLAGKLLVESADLSKVAKRDLPKFELIREWTLHIATGDRLPALERAAGVTLSHLGDPREEITTLDHMLFCLVPAGDFVMSEEDDGKQICPHLDYPFWMGRFPVTNAQFRFFTDAGGYADEKYWEEAIREKVWKDGMVKGYYDEKHRNHPERFLDPFGLPNHPVVGVTWYEAMAFARWLEVDWRKWGLISEDWLVGLPTEAQWEKAARGGLKVPEQESGPACGKNRDTGRFARLDGQKRKHLLIHFLNSVLECYEDPERKVADVRILNP